MQHLNVETISNNKPYCIIAGFHAGPSHFIFSDPFTDFLLVTDTFRQEIYQMNAATGETRVIPVDVDHDNPVAVGFDPEDGRLYWTDVHTKEILSAFLNGSDSRVLTTLSSGN